MNTVEEYFDHVRQLIQNVSDAQAERYEEHILSATRGSLRIRLRFSDNARLEISEAIVFVGEEPGWLSYRYHYQDAFVALAGHRVRSCCARPSLGRGEERTE